MGVREDRFREEMKVNTKDVKKNEEMMKEIDTRKSRNIPEPTVKRKEGEGR